MHRGFRSNHLHWSCRGRLTAKEVHEARVHPTAASPVQMQTALCHLGQDRHGNCAGPNAHIQMLHVLERAPDCHEVGASTSQRSAQTEMDKVMQPGGGAFCLLRLRTTAPQRLTLPDTTGEKRRTCKHVLRETARGMD